MKNIFGTLEGDYMGEYFALEGMEEEDRQKLVDDHFLFMSGDPNLAAAGMERDWPEGRGIFHNATKSTADSDWFPKSLQDSVNLFF